MIGERIRYLRKEKGYSMSRLAKEAGVSKTYLSNLENGFQNNPSIDFLKRVGNILGTSINELISEDLPQENE
ncbi:MAG: helix-turn-helix transcriptional regulator [Bacillus sp. (in: firmicutes)]